MRSNNTDRNKKFKCDCCGVLANNDETHQHLVGCLPCIHFQKSSNHVDSSCLVCLKDNEMRDNNAMIKNLIDSSFTQLTNEIRQNFKNTFNTLKSTQDDDYL